MFCRNDLAFDSGTITVGSDGNRYTPGRYRTFQTKKYVWASGIDHPFTQQPTVIANPHIQTDMKVCKATEGIVKEPSNIAWKAIINKIQAETNITYLYLQWAVWLRGEEMVRQMRDPMLK